MDNQGWIKLHRKLIEKAIWVDSTPEQKVILITLLMMANHKEKEWEWRGEKYKAKPGQFVTSLNSIVKNAGSGISIQNVRTAIERFEKYEFLTNQSTKRNRLITIVNWEQYQSYGDDANKDTNKELTKSQQRANKELTTNKNDNNDNNDNKYDSEIDYLLYLFNEESKFNVEAKHLEELLNEDLNWVKEALSIAESKNIYNISYVKTILKNWNKNGKPENKSKTKFHNFEGETSSMADNDINDKVKQLMEKRRIK